VSGKSENEKQTCLHTLSGRLIVLEAVPRRRQALSEREGSAAGEVSRLIVLEDVPLRACRREEGQGEQRKKSGGNMPSTGKPGDTLRRGRKTESSILVRGREPSVQDTRHRVAWIRWDAGTGWRMGLERNAMRCAFV
jgi:hypothetical protein